MGCMHERVLAVFVCVQAYEEFLCECICHPDSPPICYIYLNCCSPFFLLHFDKFVFPGSLWGQSSICCYLGLWYSQEDLDTHTHTHTWCRAVLYKLQKNYDPIRREGVFKKSVPCPPCLMYVVLREFINFVCSIWNIKVYRWCFQCKSWRIKNVLTILNVYECVRNVCVSCSYIRLRTCRQ